MRKLYAVMLILSGLSIYAVSTWAQGESGNVVGGDEIAVRKLLDRVVNRYTLSNDEPSHILVSELPTDLPYDVPLPEDADLLGSVTASFSYTPDEIFFDTHLSVEEIENFYATALKPPFEQPQVLANQPQAGGFGAGDFPPSIIYCYNEADASLTIMPQANKETGLSNVVLQVQAPALMDVCHGINPYGPYMYAPLPPLSAPEGVILRTVGGGGGGGGGGGVVDITSESTAVLTSEQLDAIALNEFYTGEIEAAGWEITHSSSDPFGAWLAFTKVDAEGNAWGGSLAIVADPLHANDYRATLSVFRTVP